MRKVALFIAMSLDGCIADPRGGIDWLGGESPDGDDTASYEEFIRDVDTVVMGAKTYRQLATELSPGEWVYPDLTSYVVTHSPLPDTHNIRFTDENPCRLVERLKAETGKDIWICGGARVAGQLMEAGAIDEYHLTIIPVLLGQGIRLFPDLTPPVPLKLISSIEANGTIDCIYRPI